MGEVSITDLEWAFQDLYKAIRLSAWQGRPYLYDIDGTAAVIYDAVVALAEKRKSNEYVKKSDVLKVLEKEREYLLSMNMNGAEHILVKHAINVIEEMPTKEKANELRHSHRSKGRRC